MKTSENAVWSANISRPALSLIGWSLLFSLGLLGNAVQGQQAGALAGRVQNQATGEYLAGAVVRLEGTNVSTYSDRDGSFRLSAPAGSHTLVVSYTGLDTERIPVSVVTGQTVTQDVGLTSQIYALDEFSVTGLREGSALAIQLQRQAPNMKTVAATDTFGNPAANPGELLQRLPGITTDVVGGEVRTVNIRGMAPAFSSLMIDGVEVASSTGTSASRDYQIEQLGTGNIETVELIKAPTPDMPGSAISGYVNLISKRAFDRAPGRRLNATVGTMWRDREYNDAPTKDRPGLDLFVLGYSDVLSVLGGENNLGISANFNYRKSSTLQEETSALVPIANTTSFLLVDPANPLQRVFGSGDFAHPSVGYNLGLNADYKLSDDSYAYVRASVNQNYHYQSYYRSFVQLAGAVGGAGGVASFEPGSTFQHQTVLPVSNSAFELRSSSFTKKARVYTISGGTEHKLMGGEATLSLSANYSLADLWYPGYIEAKTRLTNVGWELDRRQGDPWFPEFNQTAGPDILDPANHTPSTYFNRAWEANNHVTGARVDYKQNFDTAVPSYLKLGLHYNRSERFPRSRFESYTWAAGGDMTPYLGPTYLQGGGRYGPFPFLALPGTGKEGDILDAPDGSWIQTPADAYNSVTNSHIGNLDFDEQTRSAYILGNLDFGRLRIMGGVRTEETRNEGTAFIRKTVAGQTTLNNALSPEENAARAQLQFEDGRTTSGGEYRDVFPGLHFVYEPLDGLLVRASYNASIARPNVAHLLATVTVNDDTQTISAGNPDLKPFYSDNFEFSVQKYFEPIGLVEVSLFLKEIDNYARVLPTTVGSGPDNGFDGSYEGYTLNRRVNTGAARIRGIEFNYMQQFSFLPGFWRGFGLTGNFNYQETQGTFEGTSFQRRLGNFTPKSGNLGLSYVDRGLEARLLSNWHDVTYLSGAGSNSRYRDERLTFDVKLSYRVNSTYELFLDAVNITDESTRAEFLEGDLYYLRTHQGVSFAAGIKSRF